MWIGFPDQHAFRTKACDIWSYSVVKAGVHLSIQGTCAGQLCKMEEALLFPVQDERQCRDRGTGPLCVSCVCQKGIVICSNLSPHPSQSRQIAAHRKPGQSPFRLSLAVLRCCLLAVITVNREITVNLNLGGHWSRKKLMPDETCFRSLVILLQYNKKYLKDELLY